MDKIEDKTELVYAPWSDPIPPYAIMGHPTCSGLGKWVAGEMNIYIIDTKLSSDISSSIPSAISCAL